MGRKPRLLERRVPEILRYGNVGLLKRKELETMKTFICAILALFAAGAFAAPEKATKSKAPAQHIKNNFRRPQSASLKALKATVGKPFDSGWVFIDGQFVEPPYKVERYGTVIRINGFQVTNDVIPWEEFIKTQEGAVANKTETPVSDSPAGEPAAEPEEEEEEEDDDAASSLDDLFDDEPAVKKPKKAKRRSSGYKARPKKPVTTITYSFDGTFVPNEKSKALLARINTMRDRIDARLRTGGIYCVSARYSSVAVDGGPVAKQAMERLPELMKKAKSADELASSISSAGMGYFSSAFCEDLFRNRFSYLRLMERNKAIREKNKWESLGL